ncbi:MAG: hypothetical protein ABIN58_08775 [candidate division WOR-3 bacterium]
MKKALVIIGLTGFLWSAQRSVLVEAFSSTTCPHCPYSNAACERLVVNFLDTVSVIQYMQGLSGSEASYRFNFYGISGVPDVWFCGIDHELGSTDDTTGDYNRYRTKVNNWRYVNSPMVIEEMTAFCDTLSGTVECLIRIETTLPVTEPDPRVFCVITERHVWGDGRYNRFIMRDIISSPTGDSLLATHAGDTQRFTWNFSVSGWKPDSLDVTVFAQSYESKLVFQAKQMRVVFTGVSEQEPPAPGFDLVAIGSTIRLNIPGETGVNLSVYDPTGRCEREIFSGQLPGGEHIFDLAGIGRGIHIAVVSTGFGTRSVKIIR